MVTALQTAWMAVLLTRTRRRLASAAVVSLIPTLMAMAKRTARISALTTPLRRLLEPVGAVSPIATQTGTQ
jgi:hypothetical protein